MAYNMLNHLYGGHLIKPNSTTPVIGQLVLFDQTPFSNPHSSLETSENVKSDLSQWIQKHMALYNPINWDWLSSGLYNLSISSVTIPSEFKTTNASNSNKQGYIYYPSKCSKGHNKCSIHVALHGCLQGLHRQSFPFPLFNFFFS
jgi:hypothetical protein